MRVRSREGQGGASHGWVKWWDGLSLHVGRKEMDVIGDPSTGREVHVFGSHFSLASGLRSFPYHLSGPGLAQEVISEEHELCINLSVREQSWDPANSNLKAAHWGAHSLPGTRSCGTPPMFPAHNTIMAASL